LRVRERKCLAEEGAKEGSGKENASEAVAKADEDAVSLSIEKKSHKAKKGADNAEREKKEAQERRGAQF
jgi:hypothetical protein